MAVSILVMTPVRSFGELIQQALQETGLYRVTLVSDGDSVLECVQANSFPAVVLDFDLDSNPAKLVEALYEMDSGLRLIAIKDETNADTSIMDGLRLAQHLDTLFYLPDLLDALDIVTADLQHITDPSAKNGPTGTFPSSVLDSKKIYPRHESPEWLEDGALAAIHLTRLSLQSESKAALITRNAQLWAYAGHLPHPAAEELAQFVGLYWTRDGGSDFARFIRLDAVSGEYILYATGLGRDYVLALAFDTEIPFSKIRVEATGLARNMANAPQDVYPVEEVVDSQNLDAQPGTDTDDITEPLGTIEALELDDEIIQFPVDWRPDSEIAEGRQAFFEELLSSVDIPEPDGHRAPAESPAEDLSDKTVGLDLSNNEVKDTIDDSTQKVELHSKRLNGSVTNDPPETLTKRVHTDPMVTIHPSIIERNEIKPQTLDGSVPNYLLETLPTPVPDYLMDTLPTPARMSSKTFQSGKLDNEFQPLNSVYPRLTYACVLLPKLAQHHLIGDLAVFLNRCVVQVCKAFGWQLEHLSIRPNYLHWVTVIPPGTSPGHMVRIMRDHASHRIFSQFPQLTRENPSGDFWATGYLIVNGKYPLSHHLVEDFIAKTRFRQGQSKRHALNRY